MKINTGQIAETNKRSETKIIVYFTCALLLLLGLYLTSLYSYLLFHSLIESFSVVVAACVFFMTWNARKFINNKYLLFLGISYLFVGSFDLLHTLAYKGMGVFPTHGANLPTQLWIASRYFQSIAFLIAPVFLHRRLNPNWTVAAFAFVTAVLLLSIFSGVFPDCYVEGAGLTTFKKVSEYVISLIFLGSLVFLTRERRFFDARVYSLIVISIVLTVGAELAFTFYVSVYGISNLIGHYFKLISFYLIYKAIIETGFVKPYALLFRELKNSEETLRGQRDELKLAMHEINVRNKKLLIQQEELQALNEELQAQREELQVQQEELQAQHEELQAQNEELIDAHALIDASRRKYQELYDFSPIGYFNFDQLGNVIDANLRGADLIGYPRQQLEGKPFISNVASDSKTPFAAHVRNVINGASVTNEIRLIHRSGRLFPVEIESVPADSDSPGTVFCRSCIKDISERVEAEEALNAELRIRSALNELYKPLISPSSSIEDISTEILTRATLLTGSPHGFVSSIDPDTGHNIRYSLTEMFEGKCKVPDEQKKIAIPKGEGFMYPGLWGHSLNTKEPFYTNSTSSHPMSTGLPEGHIPVKRFLSVPVLLGDDLVGQISLANKESDYTEHDLEIVERLASFYALAVQRIRSEDQIRASLKEKEVLLQEVHHRVKNNLAVIISLLNLQSKKMQNEEVRAAFLDCQARIRSMALIHETLYKSADLGNLDLDRYLKSLIKTLSETYPNHFSRVCFETEAEKITLPPDYMIPCGLILNELVSNSIKHAFPRGGEGKISVSAHQEESDEIVLAVSDNGVGLPQDLDFKKSKSLGMLLVTRLGEMQLRGKVGVSSTNGTHVTVRFKRPQ